MLRHLLEDLLRFLEAALPAPQLPEADDRLGRHRGAHLGKTIGALDQLLLGLDE